ncbi:MAG: hypothetical protein O7J95_08215 [Planctomycetota bacterium]|nr:hypothetical protein [Planctomycetota bacterium]
MPESSPWWIGSRPAGFRLTARDGIVVGLCAVITWLLYPSVGDGVLVLPIVLGHFFLFCNVFRVGSRREYVWAAIFVINFLAWLGAGKLSLAAVVLTQAPVTLGVIALAICAPDYRGLGHSLRARWKPRPPGVPTDPSR